jgi:hypothetical protein
MQSQSNSDVLNLLRFDHKRVCDLLFHYEQSEDPLHKLSFAETAMNEWTIHSALEETIFYPAVQLISAEIKHLVGNFDAVHADLENLMLELAIDEFSQKYDLTFSRLSNLVKEHIEQEESGLFTLLEQHDLSSVLPKMQTTRSAMMQKEAAGGDRSFTPQSLLFKDIQPHRHAGS